MKQWLHNLFVQVRFRKIRSRFFAAMILLSVPPLAILGYISFNIAKETLMDTNKQTTQDHLRTSSEVADLMFRNVINLNRSVILNNDIRDDLRASRNPTAEEQSLIKDRTMDQLQKMINSNFLDSRFVDSICLYDLRFEAYCLGRSDDAGIYEGENKYAQIEQSDWYQKAFKRQGGVVFFSSNILGDKSNTFSTVKLFRDSDTNNGEPIGLLVINISKSIFDTIFTRNIHYSGEFLAIDSSDDKVQVIYPKQSKMIEQQTNDNLEATYRRLQDQGYLSVNYENETTGWIFIHVIAMQDLLKESNKIGWATALIASVIGFIALVLSFILSGSITKPLLQLKKMMVKWTTGTRDFDETFEEDEVGAIGESFKRMSSVNEELSERLLHSELKERDAELRALQAQIKPHFLYNTLDSIYWMATLQNNHDVAQMSISLSESFKLSLNKGKETIPLYKELKHVEHYMTIQNIRYNNRFQYIEDVEPAIMGIEILKLLLQPLVENAIYHGLEPKVGEGTISLTGRKDGQFVQFTVKDDGVGIEDMAKTEQGYGLRNVKERILLFYGESSSFVIVSEANVGTKIVIRFKYLEEGGAEHA
ncbi:cache domain-containing sensor histidine kinase [Paenibacillus sp. YIM B09110]|uniref:cache domain-containing sensor histidine kinase n=1 Tax=Paenibacillus sp. YIM B09110 TaxID=3126102 RepID=UPI00301C30D8